MNRKLKSLPYNLAKIIEFLDFVNIPIVCEFNGLSLLGRILDVRNLREERMLLDFR